VEQFEIDEVIEGIRKGDEDACFRLVERYRDGLFNFILQRIPNPEDANDIVQESFTKCFKKIALYDSRYSFSTWLYAIAQNSAFDFLRKGKIISVAISSEGIERGEGGVFAPSPEEQLIEKQGVERLIKAIRELSSTYREVAELRFIHDYPLEEIATELKIPLNTVKSRVRRAKKELFNKW